MFFPKIVYFLEYFITWIIFFMENPPPPTFQGMDIDKSDPHQNAALFFEVKKGAA